MIALADKVHKQDIPPRAYREKKACNAQTTKFLLLLKLTFTPTQM